jgi:two-component system OmpR family response regulator
MLGQQEERILMIEDDQNFGSVLREFLSMHQLNVELYATGEEALAAYKKTPQSYKLCLIDVILPGIGGYEVAKEVREINPEVLIMFITAKNNKEDVVKGYGLGAVDFITKPFDNELSKIIPLKIKQLLGRKDVDKVKGSRNRKNVDQKWIIGDYTFNSLLRTLEHKNQASVGLSPKQNGLILMLLENKDGLLSREDALETIWEDKTDLNNRNSRSMDVFITNIRKLFVHDPRISIKNLYKSGFRLIVEGGEIRQLEN